MKTPPLSRAASLWPILLIALLTVPNLIFIATDHSVWLNDDAFFGVDSIRLFHTLHQRPAKWFSELMEVTRIKTPLLVWLGQFFVPLGDALGDVERGLLGMSLLFAFFTLYFQYRLLQVIGIRDRKTIIAGLLFMGGAPLFVTMSHRFFTDGLQALLVTMTLWLFERDRHEPILRRGLSLLFGTICLIGAKISSPLFVVPLWLHWLWSWRTQTRVPASWKYQDRVLFVAVLLLAGLLGAWWYEQGERVLRFTWGITFGEANPAKISPGQNLLEWLINTRHHFTTMPARLALVLVAGWYLLYHNRRAPEHSRILFYGGATFFFYLFHATQTDREPRHLMPFLPFLVTLFALGLESLSLQKLARFCVLVMGLHFLQTTLHLMGKLETDPTYDHIRYFGLYNPLEPSDKLRRQMERVTEKSCELSSRPKMTVLVGSTNRKLALDKAGMEFAFLRQRDRRETVFSGRCNFDYLGKIEPLAERIARSTYSDFRVITIATDHLKAEYQGTIQAPIEADRELRASGLFEPYYDDPEFGFRVLARSPKATLQRLSLR